MQPELFSTAQVSRELGTPIWKLHFLMKTGRLDSPLRIGRALLWAVADVDRARAALALLNSKKHERARKLAAQYMTEALPLEALAAQEGVTRQRIQQILSKVGVGFNESALHKRVVEAKNIKTQERINQKEQRCWKAYGCDLATFYSISGSAKFGRYGQLVNSFWEHKGNTTRRGILWELTLQQYAEIVGPYLSEIGRGKLMLRRKDSKKDFTPDNVEIATAVDHGKKVNGFAVARKRRKERAQKAKAMFDAGMTMEQVGEELGLSKATIAVDLTIARKEA